MSATPPDLALLLTEFENLAGDLTIPAGAGNPFLPDPFEFLKNLDLKSEDLNFRISKTSLVLTHAKRFLDSCDALFQPLASMHPPISAPVYGAVKFIVAFAALKGDILNEVIGGLNDVFDGLPLITYSVMQSLNHGKEGTPSPEYRAVVSALKAFVAFMKAVKGYIGVKHDSIKDRVIRRLKSPKILSDVKAARSTMRDTLRSAEYGSLIGSRRIAALEYIDARKTKVLHRLHCANYANHLEVYLNKSRAIEKPCAWSDSHSQISHWLSAQPKAPHIVHQGARLFISGKPGTGKSVLAAYMIQKLANTIEDTIKQDASHRGLLLYYFCGADPTADPYSELGQKAASKTVLMSFLRQILERYRSSADLAVVQKLFGDVLATQSDKFMETALKEWIVKALGLFDTVRIVIDAVDQLEDLAFQKGGLVDWTLRDITADVLLIGCEELHMTSMLSGLPTLALGSTDTTQTDLEAYCRLVVGDYINEPVEENLIQDLVQRSENMFLYVFFLQDMTKNKDLQLYTAEQRGEFVQGTPRGIFKIYSYYLSVQLQGIRDHPALERVLWILLQFLSHSPSPVTLEILLEALQLHSKWDHPLLRKLELTRNTIERLAQRSAGILFDVRTTAAGLVHLVPVHRTLLEYFTVAGGNPLDPDNILGGFKSTTEGEPALAKLYHVVAETGPESMLDICCRSLRDREFRLFLNQYQQSADWCRQCLDDSSQRGMGSRGSDPVDRDEIDRTNLRDQLPHDPAFSVCDSLKLEPSWMARQWESLKEDGEWFTECSERFQANLSDYDLDDPVIRDEILHWRTFVSRHMPKSLEAAQKALSELQTRHLSAHAFRNSILYLHLKKEKEAGLHPGSSAFKELILAQLKQLEGCLPVLVHGLSFTTTPTVYSTSPTVALATTICALERFTYFAMEMYSPKPYPHRLWWMFMCFLVTNGAARLGTTEKNIWNPSYSALIVSGFGTRIFERLTRYTLESVLLELADAERVCFTHPKLCVGIGNLALHIRELRQMVSHHLLFQTFHATKPIQVLFPAELGFTNMALLHDVCPDVKSGEPPRNVISTRTMWYMAFLGAVFIYQGFISTDRTCFFFGVFSASPNTFYAPSRQTWFWIRFASSAGVIGCVGDRTLTVTTTLPSQLSGSSTAAVVWALSIWIYRKSPASLPPILIDISTEHMILISAVPLLLQYFRAWSIWAAMANIALLYGIIRLGVFALDWNGMKMLQRDLARIGGKYRRTEIGDEPARLRAEE